MIRTTLFLGAVLVVSSPSVWGQKNPANRTLEDDAKLLAAVKMWKISDIPATVDGKKTKVDLTVAFMVEAGESSGNVSLTAGNSVLLVQFELVEQKGTRFIKVPPIEFLKNPGLMLEYTLDGDKLTLKKGKATCNKTVIDFGDGVTLKAGK